MDEDQVISSEEIVTVQAEGTGEAFNPSVVVENNVARLTRELNEARAAEEAEAPARRIAAAERAIEKADEAAAAAEDALVQAHADNEAEKAAAAAATDEAPATETEGN